MGFLISLIAFFQIGFATPDEKILAKLYNMPGHFILSPDNQWVTLIDEEKERLSIVNLRTGDQYLVTKELADSTVAWTRNSTHLFFLASNDDERLKLKVYDLSLLKSKTIFDEVQENSKINYFAALNELVLFNGKTTKAYGLDDQTGLKGNKNPSTEKMSLWNESGVYMATYPGWKVEKKISGKDSAIKNFEYSEKFNAVLWQDQNNQVFAQFENSSIVNIGEGVDPVWHPLEKKIVMSSPRYFGKKLLGYNLAIWQPARGIDYLTTLEQKEYVKPRISNDGSALIYTKKASSSLYSRKLDKTL